MCDKKLREQCNEFLREYYYEVPDTTTSPVMAAAELNANELYQEAIKTVKQVPAMLTPSEKLAKLRESFEVALAEAGFAGLKTEFDTVNMESALDSEVKLLLLKHLNFEELLFLDYVTKPVFEQGGNIRCQVHDLVRLIKDNCKLLYELEEESMSEIQTLLAEGAGAEQQFAPYEEDTAAPTEAAVTESLTTTIAITVQEESKEGSGQPETAAATG